MLETPPLPPGPYNVIVSDPPWPFVDRLPGNGRGAAKWYDLMSVGDICALPVREITAENAVLFLWAPNAFISEALRVSECWGFVYKTLLTWVKVSRRGKPRMGMGRYLRNCTEQCLVATRGRVAPLRRDALNVLFAEREAHSAKPESFMALVRSLTEGPRLEMFARRQTAEFDSWGRESPSQ